MQIRCQKRAGTKFAKIFSLAESLLVTKHQRQGIRHQTGYASPKAGYTHVMRH